jgi:hypothetical protein
LEYGVNGKNTYKNTLTPRAIDMGLHFSHSAD